MPEKPESKINIFLACFFPLQSTCQNAEKQRKFILQSIAKKDEKVLDEEKEGSKIEASNKKRSLKIWRSIPEFSPIGLDSIKADAGE